MFLFQLISVLLISITFYTYLANIVFLCDLDFKAYDQEVVSLTRDRVAVEWLQLGWVTVCRQITVLVCNQHQSHLFGVGKSST